MIDIDKETFLLIAKVEEKLNVDLGSTEDVSAEIFNRFIIDCLEPSVDEFPKVAQEALATIQKYYEGKTTAENVQKSRENSRRFLVKKKIYNNLNKKTTCQVRAVSCALFLEMKPCEYYDDMVFFAGLMSKIGKICIVREKLIEHFLS